MRRRTRLLIGTVAALTLGLGAGAAFAYFTSHGSGTGSGSSGNLSAVTVAAESGTPSAPLYPGDLSGDIILNVDNPNNQAVTLVSVSGGPGAITVSNASGCTAANSGVSFNNQSGLNITVPKNSPDYKVDLTGASAMSSSSANVCQGAYFNIPVTITVHEG
jgi:hypothetical protein